MHMQALVSADWHIKLGQKNVPEAWAISRYKEMFKQLEQVATDNEATIHLLLGDIFDKSPSMQELELYFEFVRGTKIRTIIIPGNHESVKKHTTFFTNLKRVTNWINPLVEVIDDYATIDGIDFIPYNKLKEFADGKHPEFNSPILCTHVRGEIPPHVKPEVPLELFERWEVVLAGDLHSYDNCQRNILYPGSPVTTSFHRNTTSTGVIVLDTASLEHTWIELSLPQLIKKTVQAGEDMPAGDYDHIIYEVEGDMQQLSSVNDNELIGKKVVKRDTDTTLILDPKLTLAEEVTEYLRYVLQINDQSIDLILQELNNAQATSTH